jgi:hypothetical protein
VTTPCISPGKCRPPAGLEPREPALSGRPSGLQISMSPARPAAASLGPGTDPISDSPMVGRFRGKIAPDGPPLTTETACNSASWKWWPGTESNHRHADFQSNREPVSARASRRPGRDFSSADRTAPRDRAHPEPSARKPTELFASPMPVNELRPSRPNLFRTSRRMAVRFRDNSI